MVNTFIYECTHIFSPAPDISILRLYPHQEKISFVPGQYVEASFNGIKLPLSIANLPQEDYLEFHLRHDDKHPFAQALLQYLQQTKKISLQGPTGKMILSAAASLSKIIFLAGGTGFAPIKALLREALFLPSSLKPLYLYWGVRRPQDAYDENLLKEWQQQFTHFQFEIVLSEPQSYPRWRGACGLVPHYLAQQHQDLVAATVFASGPYAMVQAAKTLLTAQSLPLNQLISDLLG